eukprot:scaffold303420_cov16-Prasinocladus_malaysianus.AAC.2
MDWNGTGGNATKRNGMEWNGIIFFQKKVTCKAIRASHIPSGDELTKGVKIATLSSYLCSFSQSVAT